MDSKNDVNLFSDSKTKTVSRGTILQQAGDTTNIGYKVVSGCLKSYVLDKSGKEHIVQFAPEDWFISDMDSFYNRLPSDLYIEAIEDSELAIFKKEGFADLPDWNREALVEINTKLRNSLIASNRRLISLLSATAEQRYIDFTETYPTLVQRLPLKLIASYIGITPEYLSELRRKLARK